MMLMKIKTTCYKLYLSSFDVFISFCCSTIKINEANSLHEIINNLNFITRYFYSSSKSIMSQFVSCLVNYFWVCVCMIIKVYYL